MAQQINLYSPILLTPRRYFSALAMTQALAALLLGLLLMCGWSVQSTQALRDSVASATAADSQERQRLAAELARRPAAPRDSTALEQELVQARRQLAERQAVLAEIGHAPGGSAAARSALLRLLAQTLPASAWLTEVRLADGRVELLGQTLRPEELRPWLATLAQQPALAGQTLRAVKVERRDGSEPDAWAFHIVSGRDAGAPT
jgi:Tfp pilus assembly protein PilN